MATYDLKYPGAAIDAILDTAYDLQNAGYIFRGLASEYSNTPTERSWVLAGEGETGHGFTSPVPKGYIGVCVFNGTSWTGKLLKCVSIDSTPTNGSTNALSSGGAYASINNLATFIDEALDNLTFTDTTPSAFLGNYINMKVSTTDGGIERILTFFTILAATTEKAGLLSAADKQKIDSFLGIVRSLEIDDTTAYADLGTKIVDSIKATIGGTEETISTFQILAATASKAGLLSAADKAKLDALWSSGYQFAGIATPSTTPLSTTSKIFYIATEAGTYFNAVTIIQGINILSWDGSSWSAVQVVGIDDEPTAGSSNPVESGGIAKIISKIPSEMNHSFDFVDELGHILSFLDKDGWWNCPAMGIESFEFDPRGEESEYKILIVDSLNHVLAYRKPNENYVVVKKQEEGTNVYERNADTIAIAVGVAGVPSYNRLQFMIVTDTHTYPNAYVNALSIAKKLPDCAAVIHLGDVNNQVGVTGDVEEYYRKMFAENKAIYPVVGNHDVGEYDRLLVHISVDKLLYNCSIQPMIDKGYLSEGEYVPDELYYYKDFPTQKVRLIVLDNYNGSETLAENEYWDPVTYNSSYNLISQSSYTTGDYVNIKGYDKYSFKCTADVRVNYNNKTTSPSIKEYRRCCWYSEDQLEWLCEALVGAAQNEYMCVIASHQVVVFPNLTDFDSEFTSQYAGDSIGGYMSRFDENNITIINDIVKAFYEKDSVSKHMEARSSTPSENGGTDDDDASSEPAFDFSYNFRESEYEPTKVTFIHGHNHRDSVCVPSDTETYPHQVSIGFTNADVTRSTRNNVGLLTKANESNDILTAYTILDEDHIHLCRIGRNVTDRIVNRKVVVKDNQIVEM